MNGFVRLAGALCLLVGMAASAPAVDEYVFDIGAPGDESVCVDGFYSREGPMPKSGIEYVKTNNFRWAQNKSKLALRVFPDRNNEIVLEGFALKPMKLILDTGWETEWRPTRGGMTEANVTISRVDIGSRTRVMLTIEAVDPVPVTAGRMLFLGLGKVIVRPLASIRPAEGPNGQPEFVLDIGGPGEDPLWVAKGFHGPEGPYPKSKEDLYHERDFRWAGNEFTLETPAFPKRDNQFVIEGRMRWPATVRVGDWEKPLPAAGPKKDTISFTVPAAAVGDREQIRLDFQAVTPRPPVEKTNKVLFMTVTEVRIRPASDEKDM